MLSNEEAKGIGRVWLYTIIGVLLLAFVTLFWAFQIRPQTIAAERDAMVNSHQYVEARRTEILNNLEQCAQIDVQIAEYSLSEENAPVVEALRSQRHAIAARISRAASLLPMGVHMDTSSCQ